MALEDEKTKTVGPTPREILYGVRVPLDGGIFTVDVCSEGRLNIELRILSPERTEYIDVGLSVPASRKLAEAIVLAADREAAAADTAPQHERGGMPG